MNRENRLISDYMQSFVDDEAILLGMFWKADHELEHKLAVVVGPVSEAAEHIASDANVMERILDGALERRGVSKIATSVPLQAESAILDALAERLQTKDSRQANSSQRAVFSADSRLILGDKLLWLVKPLRFRRAHYGTLAFLMDQAEWNTSSQSALDRLQSAESSLIEAASRSDTEDLPETSHEDVSSTIGAESVHDDWEKNKPVALWHSMPDSEAQTASEEGSDSIEDPACLEAIIAEEGLSLTTMTNRYPLRAIHQTSTIRG